MSDTTTALLIAVLIGSTSIWVGGYIAIAVVARTAASTLEPGTRVAFFRSLGRSYFWVGTPALAAALLTGAILARDAPRDGLYVTTVTVAAILVTGFAVAVAQARRMTRLRRRHLDSPDDAPLAQQVRRGARAAGGLRAALGVLSIALVVLGSFLAI